MDKFRKFLAPRGTSSRLAKSIGVDPVLISQWAGEKRQVPLERCIAIERATNGVVRCEDLRPDIPWDVLRGNAA